MERSIAAKPASKSREQKGDRPHHPLLRGATEDGQVHAVECHLSLWLKVQSRQQDHLSVAQLGQAPEYLLDEQGGKELGTEGEQGFRGQVLGGGRRWWGHDGYWRVTYRAFHFLSFLSVYSLAVLVLADPQAFCLIKRCRETHRGRIRSPVLQRQRRLFRHARGEDYREWNACCPSRSFQGRIAPSGSEGKPLALRERLSSAKVSICCAICDSDTTHFLSFFQTLLPTRKLYHTTLMTICNRFSHSSFVSVVISLFLYRFLESCVYNWIGISILLK